MTARRYAQAQADRVIQTVLGSEEARAMLFTTSMAMVTPDPVKVTQVKTTKSALSKRQLKRQRVKELKARESQS